jgi:phosphohistidine swiveling domain-containing protein
MEKEGEAPQLSAELTRLVQSFEDPRTLPDVRTLHGLKRYLHQRGLRLGVKLVGAGGATNRTVDLLLASGRRILHAVQRISYVDFEAWRERAVPHAVALVADGFARQALYGQEAFPRVQVFCYGNEVHYYLSFRNHPAFLRIDYSPPLAGGMIDLEYFGVSVYEQSIHPCPSLEALSLFFRRLDFDVRIEGTRVHARYDKERALGLGDLCEKAELLCGLIPYLMDLDWTIGSLELDDERRRAVADAWSESFVEWGVLPLGQLLTPDRKGVIAAEETLRVPPPEGFLAAIRESLARLGLDAAALGEDAGRVMGQLRLERRVLRPVREAVARGQVVETAEGLRARPAAQFERMHEAEVFAEILASGDPAGAAQLARLVAPLERTLRFRTSGRVNGYEVQRAPLALRGETLGLYVLRDAAGIVRLALVAEGDVLCRVREPGGPWRPNWSDDPAALAALLRRDNYLAEGTDVPACGRREEAAAVRESFRTPNPVAGARRFPGERVLQGYRASPGRAVGTALFGTRGRTPEELDGALLVAPSVRPEDTTFLYHAAGIVSTGGGILSHAGLIATQFRKPALIVSGEWRCEADGSRTLLYRTPEYREEQREVDGWPVSLHREWREREHRLREGDLVVLDVAEGTLRVLGSEPDALSLHKAFRLFGEASRRLSLSGDDAEVLVLRGLRLRATHEIRKVLGRLADHALARHAAHELLLGEAFTAAAAEGARLLSLLLANPLVGEGSREHVTGLAWELARRSSSVAREAAKRIPASSAPYEVLALRLEARRLAGALDGATALLRECGIAPPPGTTRTDLDELALDRLRALRAEGALALRSAGGDDATTRHRLRQLERLDLVLGRPEDPVLRLARVRLRDADEAARRRLASRRVLAGADAGFGLHSMIGWKAANLAEVNLLAGGDLVPPWFVVTDRAFQEMLDSPLDSGSTVRAAVAAVLARRDLDNAQKSARIRGLWEAVKLPGPLEAEVVAAYGALAAAGDAAGAPDPFVAIRSSTLEEDAEAAARAGEFETFLFVRGEAAVLEHLKRAWSGLWTERAIHNRAVLGLDGAGTGGGVVVQRMVSSRVSGVLQTVNVAEGQLGEMVVNAGLGLGEGIVSGTVAADHVVVMKEGDLERGPLRFRYVTADKREQVVFNARTGYGTARVECLYHQGLRPALEYVELSELVRVAARLEAAYGHPLDLEFGIEGSRLYVLQARPVATFLSVLRETLERRPLARVEEPAAARTG